MRSLTLRHAILTAIATVMLTGCTGTAAVAPASKPAVASAPAQSVQAAAPEKPAEAVAPAKATTSGACPALTPDEIKAITGQDVA